ncbi:DUF3853 family protein [Chryseobacterium sp. JV274]|uniref:DUF3853 family protein n=1 Tax=Chryseobacterium sp. JV274 TaxID=1932669 RepID=UPI00098782D0|nr:DUF3853 family protein [Chryseobacterium sp. JV274]
MISSEILSKPLFTMTGGEILELFNAIKIPQEPTKKDFTDKHLVYGLSGLATLLNCGKTNAQKIKNSGDIDGAIIQNGKKLIFDSNKVLELLQEKESCLLAQTAK